MGRTQVLRQRPVVPTQIFAVLLVVFVNAMFFAAFLSSYFVIKRGRTDWISAATQLPVMAEGFNTCVLIMSGLSMIAAARAVTRGKSFSETRGHLVRSLILGVLFLGFQATSAAQLIGSGLTIRSSVFGGYYFLITGFHGLNVLAGIGAIAWLLRHADEKIGIAKHTLIALQFFWLFVVGIWPILYAEIFLYS